MPPAIAHRGYVLQTGEIVISDSAEKLKNDPTVQKSLSRHGVKFSWTEKRRDAFVSLRFFISRSINTMKIGVQSC